MSVESDKPEKPRKTVLIFGSVMVTREPVEPKKVEEIKQRIF